MAEAIRVSTMRPEKDELERINIYGLYPTFQLIDYLIDYARGFNDDQERADTCANEIKVKIEDVYHKLSSYSEYMEDLKARLKKLSPDDSLLKAEEEVKDA
jgi:hypothetical protein